MQWWRKQSEFTTATTLQNELDDLKQWSGQESILHVVPRVETMLHVQPRLHIKNICIYG